MATGLQVIAQPSSASVMGKLYTNQSMDLQTPVTVQVERGGVYQVTLIAIRGERGILDSGVEYAEQIMMADVSTHIIMTPTIPGDTFLCKAQVL